MASSTPKDTLDALFTLPKTSGMTAFSPGISQDSAETLVRLLKDNHERFHIFFNERKFHNHASHHLYAIFALGAPSEVLEAAYKTHVDYQKPAFDSPEDITGSNWKEHLGDERYYRAYLKFFSSAVLADGIDATLDKYIFSTPQMLNRLLSGVLHPLIHAGHALEFGSLGMLVEGFAMACVSDLDFDALVPRSLFVADQATTLSSLTSMLSLSSKSSRSTHSFTIIARILRDPELAPGAACTDPSNSGAQRASPLEEVLSKRGELIRKYADEWMVGVNNKEDISAKVDELLFVVTLLYGVSGLQDGKKFKADFFTMHLVTSSLFLPAYLKHISLSSQIILLRVYFASVLSVWVARGRPALPIAEFYARTSPILTPPGPVPTPDPSALTPGALAPNAWHPVLQSTLLHPNEHLPKAQRALAYFAEVYGDKPAGTWKGTELEDADKLDGTLFVRVASLTMTKLGWLREGEAKGNWDFAGFWE
ncbi:hypothetical protein DFH11DRAFT_1688725 [Phellopilus nigrolimitatus]|nr:hypothetical protein DFH11DRAFT_1688725 [Phellopilus nigrolimitatus]